MSTPFIDLYNMSEDERIDFIGRTVVASGSTKTAFCTDSDPGKAERYIKKLLERFPTIDFLGKHPGPVEGVVTVVVGVCKERN